MRALTPLTLDVADAAADLLRRLRAGAPRVHCLTNAVAQNFTANVLLAVGAVPSMTLAPEEVGDFVARAHALLINLGTLDRERREAAEIAVARANGEQRPWVLDPVFVERSPARAAFARSLVASRPRAIRLNTGEFQALAAAAPTDDALRDYAQRQSAVLALTGATDVVTDGARTAKILNGDPLMGQVTAMGCAGAALLTACLAVEADAWLATAAALLAFAVAGERAATRARGPGSFAVELIDTLAGLDRDALRATARME
jgi:hydroxyethylthiazole kinase